MFTTQRVEISCSHEKRGDMRDLWCLLTTLITAKDSGIAQLRYKKREKAQKISINILTFPGWVGWVSRETYN